MGPEFPCLEARASRSTTEDLSEARSDRYVLDGVQPQQGDRTVDGTDLPGKTVEGRVHDLEDPGTERGVGGDDLVQITGRTRRILDHIDDVQGHFRERRHVGDALDDFMCDGL